jgi:hypothetical protein
MSIPMVFSYGVTGIVFCSADLGGFFDAPDFNLLVRWYQFGAWLYAFFHCYCHLKSASREIYTMTDGFREVAREAVVDRYRDPRKNCQRAKKLSTPGGACLLSQVVKPLVRNGSDIGLLGEHSVRHCPMQALQIQPPDFKIFPVEPMPIDSDGRSQWRE